MKKKKKKKKWDQKQTSNKNALQADFSCNNFLLVIRKWSEFLVTNDHPHRTG